MITKDAILADLQTETMVQRDIDHEIKTLQSFPKLLWLAILLLLFLSAYSSFSFGLSGCYPF
jgi:hypothetical protein